MLEAKDRKLWLACRSFVGHRTWNIDDVLDAAVQPVLVLENGNHDFGDAQRGYGEVVGAQAERGLADSQAAPAAKRPPTGQERSTGSPSPPRLPAGPD